MDQATITQALIAGHDGLSAQLQLAARYVLDHPRDVALLGMREQARQAGVTPATLTRLAKRFGLTGYDDLRELHIQAIREQTPGFADRADAQVETQKLNGDEALGGDILTSIAAQVAEMATPPRLAGLAAAARTLAKARRIFCLGQRSSHAVAAHFNYVLSLSGDRTTLLDGSGAYGVDAIRHAGPEDAVLAVSVRPYTRQVLETATFAADGAVPVVAITDSEVSPLVPISRHALLVPTASPTFYHSMAPAFVIAEALAVLVAGHGGEAALEALRRTDRLMAALNIHVTQGPARRLP